MCRLTGLRSSIENHNNYEPGQTFSAHRAVSVVTRSLKPNPAAQPTKHSSLVEEQRAKSTTKPTGSSPSAPYSASADAVGQIGHETQSSHANSNFFSGHCASETQILDARTLLTNERR